MAQVSEWCPISKPTPGISVRISSGLTPLGSFEYTSRIGPAICRGRFFIQEECARYAWSQVVHGPVRTARTTFPPGRMWTFLSPVLDTVPATGHATSTSAVPYLFASLTASGDASWQIHAGIPPNATCMHLRVSPKKSGAGSTLTGSSALDGDCSPLHAPCRGDGRGGFARVRSLQVCVICVSPGVHPGAEFRRPPKGILTESKVPCPRRGRPGAYGRRRAMVL